MIPLFGATREYSLAHGAAEAAIVAVFALIATSGRPARWLRTLASSLGLLSSSAVLIHMSGGLIEMHFHVFVMVNLVALYQDWVPFLAAIGYVGVHHGVVGALDPGAVFNHPAALRHPWKWAGVHAVFVAGMSAVSLVTWRLNEMMIARRREAERHLVEEKRIIERLNEVGRSLSSELEIDVVMKKVTEAATELTSAQFGAFFYNVDDGKGGSYLLHALAGLPDDAFAGIPQPRNTPLFSATFGGERVVRIDDIRTDPRYGRQGPYFGLPRGHPSVRSYLAVPVVSRTGGVIGGLFFGHGETGRFTEDDERIAIGIAASAAIAIDNARLYDSERAAHRAAERDRHRLEVMAEASRVLASSLELEVILNDLAAIVVAGIGDTCVVYLRDEAGTIQPVAAAAAPAVMEAADHEGSLPAPDGEANPVTEAITTGRSIMFEHVDNDLLTRSIKDPAHLEVVRRIEPTSAIIVPLRGHREIFGAMAFGTCRLSGKRLSSEDLAIAEDIARRAGVAVENARLFQTQRTAAETLQHSLLPQRLPQIPGIETAACYRAGGPGVEVGGDWYDVIELRDGSLGLVMGDVVGKGVTAAALMGQLRNALRAFALEGHSPAGVVERLNRLLHESAPDAMATLVYAIYDPETGTLRVTNAGHPPPLVVGIDTTPSYFEEGRGLPLGASPRAVYPEAITTLTPGASVVLYTDGLVEDRTITLDQGLERLRGSVEGPIGDMDGLCNDLLDRSLDGRQMKDDIAILAMRAVPLGSRLWLRPPTRPQVLKPLRATLRRWLANNGVTEADGADILLAVGEACSNAIRHGEQGGGEFELEARCEERITIRVRSRGGWRPERKTSGGRGLTIMREFMDELHIEQAEEFTEVVMTRSASSGAVTRP